MARAHVKTGKPKGGKRSGAGRGKGSKSSVPYGGKLALRAAGLRVPEGAPDGVRELADEALGVIVEVMRGRVDSVLGYSSTILRAATRVRDEICGPPTMRVVTAAAPHPVVESPETFELRQVASEAAAAIHVEVTRLRKKAQVHPLDARETTALTTYSRTLLQHAESQEKLLTSRRNAVAKLSDDELVAQAEAAIAALRANKEDAPEAES